ncbi:MAG: ABC transporter permease [Candidatus Bathyarchaeota archaeon]|nr:MAG: ABC transporter permease [Candidatus Bathyarchaeota archaeon]
MGSLTALIIKEVKELIRDPKILIGVILMPLIIFPIMGSAISISQESVQRALISASFAIYNEDQGLVTDAFLEYLYANNTVVPLQAASLEEAIAAFQETNATTLLHIREGYSDNITRGLKGELKIYANLKSLSIAEAGTTDTLGGLVNIYSYVLSITKINTLLEQVGEAVDARNVRNPLTVDYASIIKGTVLEVAPSSIFSIIMSQSILLPVMMMVMLMFAIQMAATSIALEKEQKTLETLMTLPVGRMTILSGKLAGSIVVGVGGAISYMIGFSYYMTSAFSFAPEMTSMTTGDVGLGLEPIGMLLLGVNIFITLVSGLALAISLATFTDDVRSAQSLTGFLILPVILPAIILMFSDISMLPPTVQWILLAIPYTHSILASKAAFLGNYQLVIRSIAYIAGFTVAVLYIAARIFSTERIITSRFTSFSLRRLLRRR